jgi:hypothetical protein
MDRVAGGIIGAGCGNKSICLVGVDDQPAMI